MGTSLKLINNMKQLFVPSDISLMAKEKGFDEECFTGYNSLGDFIPRFDGFASFEVAAPLYQQLIDWFRNKHGIVIWIETAPYVNMFNYRYYIETSDNRLGGNKSKDYYKVYNEALIEGFKLIK